MIRPLTMGLLALALGACGTVSALGGASDGRQALLAAHRARAEAAEQDGRLRQAIEQWKVVRAIDPHDATASGGLARVQTRITRLVAECLTDGKAALARGSQIEARRKLLTVLALDPNNQEAFTLLQGRVRDVDYIVHTVKAGDTLASLAERYYGDRVRSEVIWETNRLPPNPRLAVGTTLKIPAIPGVPLMKAPRQDTGPESKPAAPSLPDVGPEPEANPLLVDAREALERADYVGTLGAVDRLLAGDPANREALDLKKLALYRQGQAFLDQKSYDESYRALGQLVHLQRDYENVSRLLVLARAQAAEQHYREGIRLYREERLTDAITQWRTVLELEPGHASARKNIEQAERLLHSLEERQKK